eukprot:1160994-Pelagomonas_calceolata.AAC.20
MYFKGYFARQARQTHPNLWSPTSNEPAGHASAGARSFTVRRKVPGTRQSAASTLGSRCRGTTPSACVDHGANKKEFRQIPASGTLETSSWLHATASLRLRQ